MAFTTGLRVIFLNFIFEPACSTDMMELSEDVSYFPRVGRFLTTPFNRLILFAKPNRLCGVVLRCYTSGTWYIAHCCAYFIVNMPLESIPIREPCDFTIFDVTHYVSVGVSDLWPRYICPESPQRHALQQLYSSFHFIQVVAVYYRGKFARDKLLKRQLVKPYVFSNESTYLSQRKMRIN